MADIVEVILADHRRIRRLVAAVQESGRRGDAASAAWPLGPVWRRLAAIVELHAEAEQEICYLEMFGSGPPGAAQWRDAVADHDDIRAMLAEAALQPAGSPAWWRAVAPATRLICDQMEAEERGVLACFARRAAPQLRHELAQRWASFVAARIRDEAFGAVKPSPGTPRTATISSSEPSGAA